MRIPVALVLVLLLLLPVSGFGAGEQYKDPFLAASLSWFMPGLGQAYTGNTLKGVAFWVIDRGLFWGAVLNYADFSIKLEKDIGLSVSIRKRDNLSKGRVWLSAGLAAGFVVFHLFNVIDAANDAHAWNQQRFMRSLNQGGVTVVPLASGTAIGYAFPF